VVFAAVVDKPVGIVEPVLLGGVVELRSVVLVVDGGYGVAADRLLAAGATSTANANASAMTRARKAR
jgi:hypothetical protein